MVKRKFNLKGIPEKPKAKPEKEKAEKIDDPVDGKLTEAFNAYSRALVSDSSTGAYSIGAVANTSPRSATEESLFDSYKRLMLRRDFRASYPGSPDFEWQPLTPPPIKTVPKFPTEDDVFLELVPSPPGTGWTLSASVEYAGKEFKASMYVNYGVSPARNPLTVQEIIASQLIYNVLRDVKRFAKKRYR